MVYLGKQHLTTYLDEVRLLSLCRAHWELIFNLAADCDHIFQRNQHFVRYCRRVETEHPRFGLNLGEILDRGNISEVHNVTLLFVEEKLLSRYLQDSVRLNHRVVLVV